MTYQETWMNLYEIRMHPSDEQVRALLALARVQLEVKRLCAEATEGQRRGHVVSLAQLTGASDAPEMDAADGLLALPEYVGVPEGLVHHAVEEHAWQLARAQSTQSREWCLSSVVSLSGPGMLSIATEDGVRIVNVPGVIPAELHRLPRWAYEVSRAEAHGMMPEPLETSKGKVSLADAWREDIMHVTREWRADGPAWILEVHYGWLSFSPRLLAPVFESEDDGIEIPQARRDMAEIMGWNGNPFKAD